MFLKEWREEPHQTASTFKYRQRALCKASSITSPGPSTTNCRSTQADTVHHTQFVNRSNIIQSVYLLTMIASSIRHSVLKPASCRLLLNTATSTSSSSTIASATGGNHNHVAGQPFQIQQQRSHISSTPTLSDRIVVAVGGNALQRRGDRLTIENMLKAAAEMAPTIVNLAKEHELVLTHGNGPQVGELALERSAAR